MRGLHCESSNYNADALVAWLFQQVRKPSGWLGRRVVRAMNLNHATMTDWELRQVTFPKSAAMLDVGSGGGRTVKKLLALAPEGTVVGLDYSSASVAVSRDTNADEIEASRVQIEEGSVATLPFPDRSFDIVTAVERRSIGQMRSDLPPTSCPSCLDLLVSAMNGPEELSGWHQSRTHRLNWQTQKPRCLGRACPRLPSTAQGTGWRSRLNCRDLLRRQKTRVPCAPYNQEHRQGPKYR